MLWMLWRFFAHFEKRAIFYDTEEDLAGRPLRYDLDGMMGTLSSIMKPKQGIGHDKRTPPFGTAAYLEEKQKALEWDESPNTNAFTQ